MTTATTPDQAKMDAFMGKVFQDFTGASVVVLCSLGDRLGLFNDLDRHGPASSAELAERAGVEERYVREWLSALAAAGYLEYEPTGQRFTLPPEHAPALAHEGGPSFIGGGLQMFPVYGQVLEPLAEAFRQGGGVPFETYHEDYWAGMERSTAMWFDHLLVQQWLPTVPDVQAKLEHGALLADIGCGRGRALINLAQAFPAARFVGYDAFGPNIERARANAEAAGVADRVRFEQHTIAEDMAERYDIITTFDVVHDAAQPLELVTAIRRALRPDGIFLCLEVNCLESLEENSKTPFGAAWYSGSLLYCLTTSLAQGGAGLGACGLPEPRLRELCLAAGFRSLRKLPVENPFNNMYEVRP
jgi:2-polyprenyl-3-methyl-5-hydroxy-6-metoxy-1,4-benzoquinol methylase